MTDEMGPGTPTARSQATPEAAACPKAELLAAYLDGTLGEMERQHVAEHVSTCEDCYAVVRGTLLDIAAAPPSMVTVRGPRPMVRSARWFLPLAATLILGIGGGLLWRHQFASDPYDEAVRPLVEAVGERRFFEPRLTGGFRFGPPETPVRSSAAQARYWELFAAASEIRNRAQARSTPEAKRALAAASLVVGASDEAISSLSELAKARPDDVSVYTDLAAALLVRAADPRHSADVPAALDAANRALALKPACPEALHNRALALETLGLREEAIAAWKTLARGHDAWAAEAGRRARQLEQGSSPRPQPRSNWDPKAELQHWAQAHRDGRSAEPFLRTTAATLDEYRQQTGDLFYTAVFQAAIQGDSPRRDEVVAGLKLLAAAEAAANGDRWQESLAVADRARDVLRRAASPLSRLAAIDVATASYYLGDLAGSASTLKDVLASAPKEHRSISARAHWMLGLVEFVQEHPFSAAMHHASAARLYGELRQADLALFLRSLLAQDLYAEGQTDAAWQTWREVAADRAMETLSARRRFTILWEMARRLLDIAPFAARELLDEAVGVAGASGDTALSAAAFTRRGRAALRTGDVLTAADDERRAADLALRVPGDLRGRWAQDLSLLTGELRQYRSPLDERNLEATYRYFADRGHWLQALEIAERLASIAAGRGDLPLAVDRARESLDHVAATRGSARDTFEQSQYQERFERLHARYVIWLARSGRSRDAALLALDPSKGRERAPGHREAPFHADGRVLVLAEGDGRAFGWLLNDPRHAEAFRECLTDEPLPQAEESGTAALIERCLGGGSSAAGHLTIVPAGRFRWLDWASVFRALDIEFPTLDFSLGVVVSSSRAARGTNDAGRLSVLAFNQGLTLPGIDLPALALVETDVKAVTAYRPHASVVVRGAPSEILSALGSSSIVHIAGHLIHESPTGANTLPVTDGKGGVEFLDSRDVAGARWSRPPALVFLNACASGPGRTPSPLPMARAFLLAGVAEVIATSRPVSDALALEAAKAFYGSTRGADASRMARVLRALPSTASVGCPPYIALTAVRLVQQVGGKQ